MTTLVFDYDGTLHDCIKIYAPAFRKAYAYLTDRGLADPREFSDSEISRWLGYTADDMWRKFQPQLSPEIRRHCKSIIGDECDRLTKAGKARLFDGAQEVLGRLKNDGYAMIFLSNCRTQYCRIHRELFELDRFFDEFYPAEDFGFIPKSEILRRICRGRTDLFLVIGDRFHDMEAAALCGFKSIGCRYGYALDGELDCADEKVGSVLEIPSAVKRITEK
jgi:phosphoglycolate phosphatase